MSFVVESEIHCIKILFLIEGQKLKSASKFDKVEVWFVSTKTMHLKNVQFTGPLTDLARMDFNPARLFSKHQLLRHRGVFHQVTIIDLLYIMRTH